MTVECRDDKKGSGTTIKCVRRFIVIPAFFQQGSKRVIMNTINLQKLS
jgi:hypothetical protein